MQIIFGTGHSGWGRGGGGRSRTKLSEVLLGPHSTEFQIKWEREKKFNPILRPQKVEVLIEKPEFWIKLQAVLSGHG